jgi:two-component system sensor histidine kinase BarA
VLLSAPEPAVCIVVRDSGIGIAEEEQSRIYDAFYQVDGSSTREHGGAGLGLSIVKRLVEAHGGRLELESAPGRGSTFRVIIPAS